MVRLFRGASGRGIGRFPMIPGHFGQPPPYEPEYNDFSYHNLRGSMVRGLPRRPAPQPLPPRHGLIHPPHSRMIPPLPQRDFQIPRPPQVMVNPRERTRPFPIHRRPLPIPPRPGMPSHMPPVIPGPPYPRPIPPNLSFIRGRGRGGFEHRGVKRLGGPTNVRSKKTQKRKEITEEMEVNKPWITDALKAAIHKKYQLFEAAKEKKAEADWQAYKDQRILVGEMKNTAKLEYIGSHPDADVEQIMFGGHPKE